MVSLPDGLHGAYLRSELGSLLGRVALEAAVTDRRLTPFSRNVLVDPRRSTELRTRAAASLLYAGPEAALSGHTALAMFGCSTADSAPVHVLLPYHRKLRARPGIVVHYGTLAEQDVVVLDGLRATAMDLALAEVLSRDSRRAGLAVADQLLGLLPEHARADFRAWTEERIQTRPDPRGRRQARALLDLATGLAESPRESWTLLALVDGGLPVPAQQYQVLDLSGTELYRLDFAWPEIRVALEYDGYEAHEGRELRDESRDADLRKRGWIVIRVGAAELKEPARMVAAVTAAFRRRGLAA
ncbi:endonuclease domain-containing protein [Amycolatopsis nigrescens]|uniref:endonuclease domain-containing protein n=1 Tax=Amycolatopsis nigrescens TaxID=381445 RepID=UPI000476CEB0|nr:DUF559 domain-containing protein [Amycolatopsis nigrescens]